MQDKKWYGIESAEVLELFDTDMENGLAEEVVAKRQAEFGANELPEPKKDPALIKFFKHFNDVLIYVLLAAAVVTLFLGHYIDTAVILMVVVINAIIGYMQQRNALSRQFLPAHRFARVSAYRYFPRQRQLRLLHCN